MQSSAEPAFSDVEWERRRKLLGAIADAYGLAHVLLYGANRSGTAVPWLTGWPVSREALVLWSVEEHDTLLVQFRNHVPLATQMARTPDVRWGGGATIDTAIEELGRRGGPSRVGVIGDLPFTAYQGLSETGTAVVDLNGAYTEARLVKSEEEIAFLRWGAGRSDAGVLALAAGARPGLDERELVDLVERGYVPRGGTTQIHYLLTTSMEAPDRYVPAQLPTTRRLRAGDVIVTEISAAYRGYAGQILRTMTVDADPTPLYRELHEVAEAAFARICDTLRDGTTAEEVLEAAEVIEDAGFTVCDDLVHGYGGGYLPPILGTRSQPQHFGADIGFRAGMTVVVQPNVRVPGGSAGVQTGELVHVTATGAERLHGAPRGLLRTPSEVDLA